MGNLYYEKVYTDFKKFLCQNKPILITFSNKFSELTSHCLTTWQAAYRIFFQLSLNERKDRRGERKEEEEERKGKRKEDSVHHKSLYKREISF